MEADVVYGGILKRTLLHRLLLGYLYPNNQFNIYLIQYSCLSNPRLIPRLNRLSSTHKYQLTTTPRLSRVARRRILPMVITR